MLRELGDVLAVAPRRASREAYTAAIVGENVLGKQTASNRRLTDQRLGELYGLDSRLPVFRVLLRLWDADPAARPLLALFCALARDPLLRTTAPAVTSLQPGQELPRSTMLAAIQEAAGERLNAASIDKVARNAGSSWTQSGHLEGRVRKVRRTVQATPGAVAFAIWLASLEGLAGEDLLRSAWATLLDAGRSDLLDLTLRAKQLGLVQARIGAGVVEIDAAALDPRERGH